MNKKAAVAGFMIVLSVRIAQATFVHPGLLSTEEDLDRMAAKVAAGEQPWRGSWDILVSNTNSFLSASPEAVSTVCAGSGCSENYIRLARDCARAYQCALRYRISGETAYGNKAVQIINAWASTHTGWAGDTNVSLRAGLYGYQLACAGELMRNYSGWAPADFTAFQNYMVDQFYARNTYFLTFHHGTCDGHYWANWDLANMASMIAIGVLADREDIFNESLNYFYSGIGAGAINNAVHFIHPDGVGQWQESGRDQGHSLMGPQLMGAICEIAWNQGIDLYGYAGNRFLAGCEFISKYNLWYDDVPFVTFVRYWGHNCDYETHTMIASGSRGNIRPGWDLVYNHYVNRMGLAAPYTKEYALKARPEGGGFNYGGTSGGFDGLGFTTLTHTRDSIPSGAVPSVLRPYIKGRQITLSWAGSAYAQSYNVKRSTTSGGPYTTLAMVGPKSLFYVDSGLTVNTTYYYVVSANNPDGESANSAEVVATADGQLHGTVIGMDGSWGDRGATKYTVFDGSLQNFFDAPSSVAWAGLDMGEGVSAQITQIKYCPRLNLASRMVGGKFQGSNTADFSSGVTDLFTISAQPQDRVLTTQTISNTNWFRYVRYLSPSGGYGNVAEVQFLGTVSGLNAPVVPMGVSVAMVSASQIEVRWSASSGATGYYLKRAAVSGGPYTIVAGGSFTEFVDTEVLGGKTYYYVVSAFNSMGQSADSAQVSVTTPFQLVNVALGCTPSANIDNAAWNAAEVAASAFDGSTATKWYTGGNTGSAGWLQADLGSGNASVVIRYDISSANDVPNRDPKNWQLLASNNGSSWTLLDTRSGEVFASRFQTKHYPIDNDVAYRYYRLNILSNYGGSAADGIQLSEFALMSLITTFAEGLIVNSDAAECFDYMGNPLSNYVAAPGGSFGKTAGPCWLAVGSNGNLSGIPGDSDVGENVFTVYVQNPTGILDTAKMLIHVHNVYSGTQGVNDLSGMAELWLESDCGDFPPCGGADLNGDQQVDITDLAILASNWLSDT